VDAAWLGAADEAAKAVPMQHVATSMATKAVRIGFNEALLRRMDAPASGRRKGMDAR
jgi:hypothetical protein